eukprot:15325983-Ditylum_brightwellii.AAC.1
MSKLVKLSRMSCCRLLVMKMSLIDIVACTAGKLIGFLLGTRCAGGDHQKMVTSVSAITFNCASRGRRWVGVLLS